MSDQSSSQVVHLTQQVTCENTGPRKIHPVFGNQEAFIRHRASMIQKEFITTGDYVIQNTNLNFQQNVQIEINNLSPLTPGSISGVADPTDNAVELLATDASGGLGTYTYKWYLDITSGFTPGPGNEVSGQTTLSFSESGLDPDQDYYVVVSYDDTAHVVFSDEYTFKTLLPFTIRIWDSNPDNVRIWGVIQDYLLWE